jgi:hypothetical protein
LRHGNLIQDDFQPAFHHMDLALEISTLSFPGLSFSVQEILGSLELLFSTAGLLLRLFQLPSYIRNILQSYISLFRQLGQS